MDGQINLSDIIGMLRRRWLLLVLPVVIGTPIAFAIAMALPSVYASTARILVESQQIPSDLARSTVGQSAAERIQLIRQRLLTRQNLLEIANTFNVFAGESGLSPTEIVARMGRAVEISGASTISGRSTNVTGITITFRSNNPTTAARVANEFVSRILARNIEDRTSRALGTVAFFDAEANRLGNELQAVERAISDFKEANESALPDSLSFRRSRFASLQERIIQIDNRRNLLSDRRDRLQEQMEIGTVAAEQMTPQEREIARLRDDLLMRRVIYADSHPSVRLLVARIEALERTMSTASGSNAPGAADAPSRQGPATRLLHEIEDVERELAILETQRERDVAEIADLEMSIVATPSVELQLNALQRRYSVLQRQHSSAVDKRSQAELGERLEAGQQAERFEVIEQALVPENPESPNRPLIVAAGVAGSGAIGFVLMVLVELLNRCIRTSQDLERQLDLRPIVAIPYIRSEREIARSRWRNRALALAVVAGIPAALFAIDRFVTPLPLLVARMLDRIGADRLLNVMQSAMN